ncbi:uncharacterized protein LOC142343112 [Convolutriloba macropyga]|uniref:uncharacterized protein LOC142343112 n=1 Tax=Convolutriloba macropyga TaxID=536237 RepID=UPI003F525003
MNTIMTNMRDEFTSHRLSYHVPLFQLLTTITFTFNEESFLSKEEQFEDILTTVVATVLSYVEKLVSLSSLLRNSEYEIYPFLDSLHIFLHNMARFNGNETTSRTYNSDNMMFVMQNIHHFSNHSEDLTCKKLDFNGVTKNTYEHVTISKEVLETLPHGSSAVLSKYEMNFGKPRQTLDFVYEAETVNYGKEYSTGIRFGNRFVKRMTDFVSVTVRDEIGYPLSIPISYSLNYASTFDKKSIDLGDIYDVSVEYRCAYYSRENNSYYTDGVGAVLVDEYRGACNSTHTTSFAVVALVDQEKIDELKREEFFYVVMIGMACGSVMVLATFLLLLYVSDLMDEEENSHHLTALFFYQLFICAYLSGADKIYSVDRVECRVASMMMMFAYLAVQGSFLNVALNLFKEYEPKLWGKEVFPPIYMFNAVIFPGTVCAVYFGLFRDDIGLTGNGYSCFPSARKDSFLFFIVTPTLLFLLASLFVSSHTIVPYLPYFRPPDPPSPRLMKYRKSLKTLTDAMN